MTRNPHRLPDRVQDILEAFGNVKANLGDMSREKFLADGKTQRAVIESLIVIGEAARKIMQLAPEIEQEEPGLWQDFVDAYDMRIILTHEYFRVDAAILWTTIKGSLPPFEAKLTKFASDFGKSRPPSSRQ